MPATKDEGKKKAPEKPEKPPEKPGKAEKTAPKPGEKSPGFHPGAIIASLQVKKLVLFSTVLLACGALGVATLFFVEMARSSNLFKAVGNLRDFLVTRNEASRTMADPQILKEAKRIVDDLSKHNNQNGELERKIQDIQQRQRNGWEPLKGHLYGLSTAVGTWFEALEDCEKNNSLLAYVTTMEEEHFLEAAVLKKGVPHWFGLRRIRTEWTWETGDLLEAPIKFWAPGKPAPVTTEYKVCGEIIPCPQASLKCWADNYCNKKQPWICKLAPDSKYTS